MLSALSMPRPPGDAAKSTGRPVDCSSRSGASVCKFPLLSLVTGHLFERVIIKVCTLWANRSRPQHPVWFVNICPPLRPDRTLSPAQQSILPRTASPRRAQSRSRMISAQSFTGTPSLKWPKVRLLPKHLVAKAKINRRNSNEEMRDGHVFSWFLAPPSGQLDFGGFVHVSHVSFLLLQR